MLECQVSTAVHRNFENLVNNIRLILRFRWNELCPSRTGDSINSDAIYHSVVRDKLPLSSPLPSKGSELLIKYFEMTENYRIMVSRDLEAGNLLF